MSKSASQPCERPILFSGGMVRAIIEGHKTQTRRVVKPQSMFDGRDAIVKLHPRQHGCPYGQPGDRLWVREAFAIECECEGNRPPHSDGRPTRLTVADEYGTSEWEQPHYRATDEMPDLSCGHERCECGPCDKPWSPSIHMPRWASRLTLEITNVKVERVQEISEADAIAEGVKLDHRAEQEWTGTQKSSNCHRGRFAFLWDSINAKRDGGMYAWEKNPWVWALEFKRLEVSHE